MSARERRHRLALPVLVVALTVLTLAIVAAGEGEGSPLPAGTTPLPTLGSADPDMILIGAAPAGEPGEAWGYRQLPLSVGGAATGAGPLAFGPQADPSNPTRQLAFMRYTDGNVWRVQQLPVDENGNPYRGPVPNSASARITDAGGGVLVGRDPRRPPDDQVVVLLHEPAGRWEAMDRPPPTALFPAEGDRPAEQLAADNGSGTVADAAFDEDGHTGLLFAPTGRSVADGILHWDGTEWVREEVDVPVASSEEFSIVALDATGLGNAWALAEPDEDMGRSAMLFQRTSTPAGPLWVERPLGVAKFANRDTPGLGISGLAPLGGQAQPLTATSEGVWIDMTGSFGGAELDATLYYDIGATSVTGSWCDAAACDTGLGVKLSRQIGYRSFAWPGPGFGTRVVTNPLDPGGSEESNRGTYLRLDEGAFVRQPGGGGNFRPTGAFANADSGWLQGPVHIAAETPPDLLRPWPVSLRAPLTAAVTAPGRPSGALDSPAIAVGVDGAVARYIPGEGWKREYLTTANGSVSKVTLRGVAWPEPSHAYAVGDSGAMWQWNAADGLWIADPGVPIGFEGNLMGVAFDPADPSRGYAVGKSGTLLRFGKSWEQEALPPGFATTNLTSIAFAGSEAIVAAGGDLLVHRGGGWEVDSSAHQLLDSVRSGNPRLFTVAGLPDGGAVAAGRDIVIERDGPSSAWRFSKQPIPGSTAIAAAAIRNGGAVRAVVSVVPQLEYPVEDDLPIPDPNVPPPILPPFGLPGDGYLLKETESGWLDQQRTAFAGSGPDRPIKSDPTLALLLDSSGEGWALGGWSGNADAAGRGSSVRGGEGSALRARVRTAAISRFGANPAAAPNGAALQAVALPSGPVRFAVAGHAACEESCAELAPVSIGPDRTLDAALDSVAAMRSSEWGPRAFLYTGNRVATGLDLSDGERFASLLGSHPSVPAYAALGSADVINSAGSGAFQTVFGGFPAPFGAGPAPAGVSTGGIPGIGPTAGARTHYAFDSSGAGGTVRVIVIDNSRGSLAAADPYQNPEEAQRPWLESVLADARGKGIPTIVVGNRSLNATFSPRLNVAEDANEIARVLVAGGASAYLFDRPEENRVMRIPAGGQETIPSWGTGTLGYRSPLSGVIGLESADSLFGDSGVILLEVKASERDPSTNRAPVGVRLIPVLQSLSMEAIDGTLLRRSTPALFSGLGRRPLGGDRWGTGGGSGIPDPAGGNPYTLFPPDQCLVAGCSERIEPEYTFTSSDDDIADFVKQDPNSTNLRKPYLDAKGKVVTDNSSGLLCPFNAGTTTVMVSAGGYTYSEKVTIQKGSVQRPCGTRPLKPGRFTRDQPGASPPPPPPPAGPGPSPAPFSPPAAPSAPPTPTPTPTPHLAINTTPPPPEPFLPAGLGLAAFIPAAVLLPPPPAVRPTPPGGATARQFQVDEEEEKELATEESHAFSRRSADDDEGLIVSPYLLALVLIAAIGGATVRGGPGARPAPGYVGRRR
ncbi:MAG TPA: hypothetical protein VIT85_01035 [Solirubrobacterales bacterium]